LSIESTIALAVKGNRLVPAIYAKAALTRIIGFSVMASKEALEAGCRARDAVLKEIVSAGEQREKLLVGSLTYMRNPNEQCAAEVAHWLGCQEEYGAPRDRGAEPSRVFFFSSLLVSFIAILTVHLVPRTSAR